MLLAIQERLLPGDTPLEKLIQARQWGLDGVEFDLGEAFSEHLLAIADAMQQTGVRTSAINAGHTRLIHPEYVVRESELVRMREAMAFAVDLAAQGVIFMGHYAHSAVLPDLHPYKSSQELEAELLTTMLRTTLCDHAYAMGTELLLEPVNHAETQLVRRIRHASIIRKNLNQPRELKICANLHHMAVEGEDLSTTLQAHGEEIGYFHLRPQQAADCAETLRASNYQGWLCFESDTTPVSADVIQTAAAQFKSR